MLPSIAKLVNISRITTRASNGLIVAASQEHIYSSLFLNSHPSTSETCYGASSVAPQGFDAARISSSEQCSTSGRALTSCLSTGLESGSFASGALLKPQHQFIRTYSNPAVEPSNPKEVTADFPQLLAAYSKSVSSQRVVHRVGKRISVAEISVMVQLYQKKLDGIAVAAVINQLFKAQKHDANFDAAKANETVKFLLPILEYQLRWCSLRTISSILWSMAKAQSIHPSLSPALIVKLLTKAVGAKHHKKKLYEVKPKFMVQLLWAASKLLPAEVASNTEVHSLTKDLVDVLSTKLHQLSPQGLSNLVAALLTLGYRDSKLVLAVAEEMASRMGSMVVDQPGPQDMVAILSAMQACGVKNLQILEKMSVGMEAQMDKFRPQDVARALAVFAGLRVKHEGVMEAAAQSLIARADQCHGAMRESVTKSFRLLKVDHPQLMEALAAGTGAPGPT